jgi:hypothetical protein
MITATAAILFVFLLQAVASINFGIWAAYMIGQLLHVLKRADMSVKSKISGVASIRQFLSLNWIAIVIRLGAGAALYELVWRNPKVIGALLGVSWLEQLPMGWAVAFLFGLLSDLLVDWLTAKVPALQNEIPKF